jgi:nicotinate-nucleotide adenylyltransferase
MKKERIGLFGGTFNPIHSGHLKAAEIVLNRFFLDEVLFIPSYI